MLPRSSAALAAPPVERVEWRGLYGYLNRIWEPGQHATVIGTTGRGKTTLGRKLITLPRRRAVVILDAKGGAKSLQLPGFVRVTKWPPDISHGQKIRLAPPMNSYRDVPEMRKQFHECLDYVLGVGRWTVYIDELRPVVEPRKLNLGEPVESLLILGRERQATVITGTQAPRWIPRAAYDQATHLFLFKILDKKAQQRLSEIGGDTEVIEAVVKNLGDHEFLYVNAVNGDMYVSQVER